MRYKILYTLNSCGWSEIEDYGTHFDLLGGEHSPMLTRGLPTVATDEHTVSSEVVLAITIQALEQHLALFKAKLAETAQKKMEGTQAAGLA